MNRDEFEQKFEDGAKAGWDWAATHVIVVTHSLAFVFGFLTKWMFFR